MSRKSQREDREQARENDPFVQIARIIEESEHAYDTADGTHVWSKLVPTPTDLFSYGIGLVWATVRFKEGECLRLTLCSRGASCASYEFLKKRSKDFVALRKLIDEGLLHEGTTLSAIEARVVLIGGWWEE